MAQASEAASHGMRSGAEYLRSLKDGRCVYVDGERVKDVTVHPAFREAAKSVARLFDIAAAPEHRDVMTYPSPKTGAPVWRAWQIPRSHDDLRSKRRAAEIWAEATFGLMGRTPDHVAGFIAGYAAKPALFAAGGAHFADNLPKIYERLRDNHRYVTYAIVPPQIDRSQAGPPAEGPDALCRRRQGARRRHRHLRRPAARDRRRVLGLSAPHLHPPDAGRRRGLCQRRRDPDRHARAQALSAARLCHGGDELLRLPAQQPFRRDGLLLRVRQRVRAVGERLHLPQPADLLGPVVEDAGSSLRQSSGPVPLRHQAALHARARPAHERDDRQRGPPGGAGRDGRARRHRLDRREHAARPGDGGADRRRRRAVAAADHALLGDGAAVRAQRPHAGDDPRARRRGDDHAAVLGARLRQPRDCGRHRALHAVGHHVRARPRRVDADGMGFPRHRVRQPPRPVREVLRRRVVPGEAERQPLLRLQARHRPGRRSAGAAAGAGGRRVHSKPSFRARVFARTRNPGCDATR